MNPPEIFFKAFHNQREEFCKMLKSEVAKDAMRLSAPSAKFAQDFAEKLILCPTKDAVLSCMQRDLEGARSFLIIADKVIDLTEKGGCEPLAARLQRSTPFYLLTTVVMEQLELSKHSNPNLWE